jgi:hypothetical protein
VFAPALSYLKKALQSVLNECSTAEKDVGFSNREQLASINYNGAEKPLAESNFIERGEIK